MSEETVEIVRRIYAAWTDGSPVESGLLDPEEALQAVGVAA